MTFVLDGGFATELTRRGHEASGNLWSTRAVVDAPEAVASLHRDYLAAGADIISTATYQAALAALAREGLDGEIVLKKAVEIARRARDEIASTRRVAASMGPYGAHLADGSEYRGDYLVGDDALTDFHHAQAEALLAASPDLLAFETIPSVREAEAILRALERLGRPPAWISFSLHDETHVAAKDGTIAAAFALAAGEVEAVGMNCAPPDLIERALALLPRRAQNIIVYPNSGEVWSAETRSWSGAVDDLGARAERYVELGARIVGGCCRTGPQDIARMKAAVSARP